MKTYSVAWILIALIMVDVQTNFTLAFMNTALCSRTMSNCVPHRHDQVLLLIHKRSYEDDNLCRDIDRDFNGKTVVINLIVDEKRCMSRRAFSSGLTLTSVFGMNGQEWTSAEAMSLFSPAKERRQLELCLVIILRLLSWAQHVESKMLIVHVSQNEAASVPVTVSFSISDKSNWNTSAYAEARLGAKALLTGRIGGGSPPRVYDLAQFQIRECFDDLLFASKNLGLQRQAQNEVDTIIDALASIVEFDGLETTQDPSPRSSLMISMFTTDKGTYVKRMINERLVPSCRNLTRLYGDDVYGTCKRFMDVNYPAEVLL